MKCTYTATFNIVDPDNDTLDSIAFGILGLPINKPFWAVSSIQTLLGGLSGVSDSATYSFDGSTATIVVVNATQPFIFSEWTIDGISDGGSNWIQSDCWTCDYETFLDSDNGVNIDEMCTSDSTCTITNVDMTDQDAVLTAMASRFFNGDLSYTWNGSVGHMQILGVTGFPVPWKIVESGTDNTFVESNCVAPAVAPIGCGDGITCDDKDIGLETLVRSTVYRAADCGVYAFGTLRADSINPAIECASELINETIDALIRRLLIDAACKMFRIETNPDASGSYWRCVNKEHDIETLFRKALYINGEGCLILKVANLFDAEGGDVCTAMLDCDEQQQQGLHTLIRKLFVTDGENVAIAAFVTNSLNCGSGEPITCDTKEIGFETLLRSTIIKTTTPDVYAVVIADIKL